ncbi:hypothetical protein IQ07DRAFT_581991 [Pyrenochaeta sp. DS3sAY3a]|nr:hypothetical protein IQ07DRAFT_581991 [Pyrenochaeta sp. DS3sAY3a]
MPRTLTHLLQTAHHLATPRTHRTRTHRTRTHWRTMAAAPPPSRPIKLLMLHGYTQSGPLFQAKTGALRKTLQKAFPAGIELVYPTAPIRLTPADESFLSNAQGNGNGNGSANGEEEQQIEAFAWWRRTNNPPNTTTAANGSTSSDKKASVEPYTYTGLDIGLAHLAAILTAQGPFDGVIGFSQGGACAAMLAALLEPGRRDAFARKEKEGGMRFPTSFEADADTHGDVPIVHPPLKFAVSYSGFAALGTSAYTAFYDPKIATPVLHFLGTQDVVVEEARSLALVKACAHGGERYVVYHPGGHFLPSTQKASVNALVGFIKEVLAGKGGEGEEESVADMDVPF